MAFVWSRLALAALVAGVAAAAAGPAEAACASTCDREPQLACDAPSSQTVVSAADTNGGPLTATIAVAPALPAPPTALVTSRPPSSKTSRAAVDVLTVAPKTSPPRT